MDYTSFSHGQVSSKLWLCAELETYIPVDARVAILGSWYNVLSFMLLTRNASRYQRILGIDKDPGTKEIADRITDAWRIGSDPIITNIIADANEYDLSPYDVVVNCSPEHMESNQWFENIEEGTIVCIQSSNVTVSDDDIWKCVNPNRSLGQLKAKYPLSQYLFCDLKEIRYRDSGYDRFMIIGIK